MLSYPINEAEELLTTRLATAKLNLSNCEEDLDFLREQITVSNRALKVLAKKDLDPDRETDRILDDGSRYSKSV
jgi:hypothetical protein